MAESDGGVKLPRWFEVENKNLRIMLLMKEGRAAASKLIQAKKAEPQLTTIGYLILCAAENHLGHFSTASLFDGITASEAEAEEAAYDG